MIADRKIVKPFIHFGFGLNTKTVSVGDTVKVWQDTIFNTKEFESVVNAIGLSDTKESDFEFTLIATGAGTFNIDVVVSNPAKTSNYTSNTITLTVV